MAETEARAVESSLCEAPDKYTRLPVTRWVKSSLHFELLVNRVMKFLLGQHLINNNIFCTT